jgi:hypothetical protein
MVDYTAADNLPPPTPTDDKGTPSIQAQQQTHDAANQPDPGDNLPSPTSGKGILDTSGTSIADIVHKLGVGTRDVLEGVGSGVGAVGDVLTWPGRAIGRAIGYQPPPGQDFYISPSQQIQQGIDALGLPKPETSTERTLSIPTQAAASTLGGGAVGPIRAGVQAGIGALVGDTAASSDIVPDWLKPTVRILGSIAGAKGTDVGANIGAKAVNAATGNVGPITSAFDRLNIPTNLVGTSSGTELGQAVEAALTRMPFASSYLRPAQQQTVDAFGNAVERTANQLDPNAVTAQTTGDIVQNSYRNWRDTFNNVTQPNVWAPLNHRLAGASVDPSNYRQALDDLTANLNLPATQKVLTPGQITALKQALATDVPAGGAMTWDQAQRLRTAIGSAMGVPEISQSVGMDALKRAYGGIAQDMRTTATQHGQGAVFDNANLTSTQGHSFIENVGSKIAKMNNPAQESVAPEQATTNLLNSGDTTLQSVRQNMPDAADALAAFKVRQMATAKPAQATSADDTSTGTFLTNANRMQQQQPGGYQALYQDPAVQQQLADLSTVAGRLRATEKHLNTSGTAETLGWMGYLNKILDAEGVAGHLAAVGKPPIVGNVGGLLMTNPGVARFAGAPGLPASPSGPWRRGVVGSVPGLLGP